MMQKYHYDHMLQLLFIVQVPKSCPTLCDPIDCSTPGFSVLEFAQTHVHWVSDTIQPSHPLLFPSPPALNLSQHQGLFQWINCLRPHGPQHARLPYPSPSPLSSPKFMSTESVMLSNHLILCCPLLLLPSNLSQHQGLFRWVIWTLLSPPHYFTF